MNLLQLSDHVVKACHWSDGGSEFVFMDGSILSFADHMNTFVAISASKPNKQKNFMVTSLCLSEYESKVAAALAVYNRFSVQPRLIHSLCQQEEQLWTHHAPIETVVLSNDPSLFSRITVVGAGDAVGRATAGCSGETVDNLTGSDVYGMQLFCAMRKVCLTVHASRQVFFVRWPARVSERDGSTCIFVRKASSNADSYASQKAIRFVWLEQMFFVDCCPPEWNDMLRLCFELDNRLPMDGRPADDPSPTATILGATPETLGAPLITPKHVEHSTAGTRFSSIEQDHAHYFVAAAHLYTISPMSVLHPAKKGVTLQWMLDHDLANKSPVAFYSAQGPTVSAFVFEDDAVIRLSTSMHQSATQPFVLKLHRVIQQFAMPSAGAAHTTGKIIVEEKELLQDASLTIPLPKSINVGNFTPLLGTFAVSQLDARGANALSLTRGRYVPFVSEALVGISRRNAEAQSVPATVSLDRTQDYGDLGSIVKLSSRIDTVGNFTALTNGVVRCHFDDRTIMTLIPDEKDTEEGLVVEVRTRSAELVVCRVNQASASAHSIMPYLEYLLPFRHFAKMRSTDYFTADRFLPESIPSQRTNHIAFGDSAQVDLIILKGAVCLKSTDDMVEQSKALLRRLAQL